MLELNIQNKLIVISCEGQELAAAYSFNSRFRMLFVLEGEGMVKLGDELLPYDGDEIFLVSPKQHYAFETRTKTRIFLVIFGLSNAPTSRRKRPITNFVSLFWHVENIFSRKKFVQGKPIRLEPDRNAANQLIQLMIYEMFQGHDSYKDVVKNSIFLLIYILARNANHAIEIHADQETHPDADQILEFIKQSIFENEKITVDEIANEFNLSADEVNALSISKTGVTFKKLIVRYRMEIFKGRLLKADT